MVCTTDIYGLHSFLCEAAFYASHPWIMQEPDEAQGGLTSAHAHAQELLVPYDWMRSVEVTDERLISTRLRFCCGISFCLVLPHSADISRFPRSLLVQLHCPVPPRTPVLPNHIHLYIRTPPLCPQAPPPIPQVTHRLPRDTVRQTLMFSATMNNRARRTIPKVMPYGYKTVSPRPERKVKQSYVMTEFGWLWCHLLRVLRHETQADTYKIMVFFPTRMMCTLYTDLYGGMDLGFRILRTGADLRQDDRNKADSEFRDSQKIVLFTTDVCAHGLDYPDVTHVLQVCPHSPHGPFV